MKKINEKIALRPLASEEENFWREVYFDSVRENFAMLGLGEDQLNGLLEMQFRGQNADYRAKYPQADFDVILYENVPVGRIIVSTAEDDINIIDMAVLSNYRSLGIGGTILTWFFEESLSSGLPIRFYVEKTNRAQSLYERLGFKITADLGSHFQMGWRA